MHFTIKSGESGILHEGDGQGTGEVLRALTNCVNEKSDDLASCYNVIIEVDGANAKDFFSSVSDTKDLWPDLADFVKAVTAIGDERTISGSNSEAFGHEAAAALVTTDVTYLPVVVDWIRTLDLEGESGIVELIDSAIAAHGVGPETLDLLAHRMTDCDGQHGESQVTDIWEANPGFGELLEPAESYKAFIDRLVELAVPIELGINPSDSFEDYKEEFFNEDSEITYYEMLVDILDAMYQDDRSRFGILKSRLRTRFLKEMQKALDGDVDTIEILPAKIAPDEIEITVTAEEGLQINGVAVSPEPSVEFLEDLLGPSRDAGRNGKRRAWDALGIERDTFMGLLSFGVRFGPEPYTKATEQSLKFFPGKLMIQGVEIVEKMTMSKVLKEMKPPYVPETDRPDRSCEWELKMPKLKVTFWLSGDTPRSRVIAVGFDNSE